MKRRNIILVPGEIQEKRMEINIEVQESTLFKFNHPSDVVAKVPQSVKNSMEYFLQVSFDFYLLCYVTLGLRFFKYLLGRL